jgi:ApbE superfamily uncharacterized protein (UPF0280 family)
MTEHSKGYERLGHGPDGKVLPATGQAGAARARLGNDRWHFQHGPIDLIIDVDADTAPCEQAMASCWEDFQQILPALVAELAVLRRPAVERPTVRGLVAKRMVDACAPFADERFITPMAAVAGAVADELIGSFERSGVRRAFINNGGDIALHLAPGTNYRVGIWSQLERLVQGDGAAKPLDGIFVIDSSTPVRGVATSGWRGRSFSLGIADSVTVLARDAAAADAAATLIANAVNCDFDGIVRAPADQLKDDSDLGKLLVTVDVPALPATAKNEALLRGRAEAERWRERGLIYAAAMFLQGAADIVLPRVGALAHTDATAHADAAAHAVARPHIDAFEHARMPLRIG